MFWRTWLRASVLHCRVTSPALSFSLRSHCVAEASLEPSITLLKPLEGWDAETDHFKLLFWGNLLHSLSGWYNPSHSGQFLRLKVSLLRVILLPLAHDLCSLEQNVESGEK